MSDPGWVEQQVTDTAWDEIPVGWMLDGSTGAGLFVGINIGEGVVYTDLAVAPDPNWMAQQVSEGVWQAVQVTDTPWTRLGTDV